MTPVIEEEKNKKLKVAICLRGYLRTVIENKKTFEYFFESDFEVDFFYHTWKTEVGAIPYTGDSYDYKGTLMHDMLSNIKGHEVMYSKIKKFKQVYKPKLGIIESISSVEGAPQWWSDDPTANNWYSDLNFHPQFVSTSKVDKLRRDYEKDNNFKYDLVINTRTDIAFDFKQKEEIQNNLVNLTKTKNGLAVLNLHDPSEDNILDDVFYAGNSDNMSTFLDYFDIEKNQQSHQRIVKNMLISGLLPVGFTFRYCIFREYCSYLDPIDDIDDIYIDDHQLTYGSLKIDHAFNTSMSLYRELIKRDGNGLF
jgi:hypothetical protein